MPFGPGCQQAYGKHEGARYCHCGVAPQKRTLQFYKVLYFFDTFIDRLPEIKHRIDADSDIVQDSALECGIRKRQIGHADDLTEDRKGAMVCLCLIEKALMEDELDDCLFADFAKKKMEEKQGSQIGLKNSYKDTTSLIPTFNVSGHMFWSLLGLTLTTESDYCQSVLST